MFIGEEAARRLHPIGVPCSGLVSQQNMAHLRSASGSGCRIYKHCTPTEWDPCSRIEAFFMLRDKDDS